MLAASKFAVIFGGNYFTDFLPVGRHWLVWDKQNTMPTFSDCELAWTNVDKKSVKRLVYEYNGLLGKREERVHPTQKPVEVMFWAVQQARQPETVFDPFMGSGTTGVACVNLGRKFTGIELDPDYFDIACKRIEEAYKQPRLFDEPKPAPIQQNEMDL
jgi:DNA modification methylase